MVEMKDAIIQKLADSAQTNHGITFIYSDKKTEYVSYLTLFKRCLALADYLKTNRILPLDKVILDCKHIESQIHMFWACAMIGAVPVLVAHNDGELPKNLVSKLGRCKIVRDYPIASRVFPELSISIEDYDFKKKGISENEEDFLADATPMNSTCCVLLSSGTTASYKLVPLTGNNILASVIGEQKFASLDENSRILTWMPFHHSGGLIIHHMTAMFLRCNIYVIPTELYAAKPILWVDAVSRFQITFTGTISSAMRVLLKQFEAFPKMNVDFSSLSSVSVGAESVSTSLCYDFEKTFEAFGMQKNAAAPTYGLTETSCAVGWGSHSGPYECYRSESGQIGIGEYMVPADSLDNDAFLVYSLSEGVQVKILDDNGKEMEPSHIGYIWIKGKMVINGYLTDMDIYQSHFSDGWFSTNDVGFLTPEGRLAVIGRSRDLMKIGGEFYSAQSIENLVRGEQNPMLEDIIVSEYRNNDGIDRIGIYVVCPEWMKQTTFIPEFHKYMKKIFQLFVDRYGTVACEIFPIPYAPKTNTKKIKRFALKELVNMKLQTEIKNAFNNDQSYQEVDIQKAVIDIIEEATQFRITDMKRVFADYGIESKNVPVIVNLINMKFGLDLSVGSLYNYPNVITLAAHIAKMLEHSDNGEQSGASDFLFTVNEDIAIVGMSNRFPGSSNTPEQFYEFLKSGADGIIDIPKERWDAEKYYSENDEEPGKMYCKKGGFIDAQIEEMDNNFFSISPKEAASIDPHQRLLLELTWEAFENAGLDITAYSGTKTGVFLGLSNDEYGLSSINSGDLTKINTYSLTGICYSTACGRISYTFGFNGPCFSVDTACSSFLTALHLAAVSLKNRDADCAVVGGASLMLTPVIGVSFSKLKAVCKDGHCKTFDESADGYGRGEGAGVIILKRLSDAERDNDNILGVIKATAINQDGRSNGLTAPNGDSQLAVIQEALGRSGLKKDDIDYIEAHGTGTSLGDPIEVGAILSGYCEGVSRKTPLYLGSVKSNIGHLEAASGAASVIKVLLSMQNEMIPGNRGFHTPSSKIKWSDQIRVVAENTPWKKGDRVRRASINSFGFGGSNAHVILEEYKGQERKPEETDAGSFVMKISAKKKTALKELVMKYLNLLQNTSDADLADLLYTANIGRGNYPNRIVVSVDNKEDLISALKAYIAGKTKWPGLFVQDEERKERKIAFMFTGQSSQYVNMAQTLYKNNSVFRDAFLKCDELFKPYLLCSLSDLVYGENADADTIEKTVYAQPLIFSVEYALTKFWESVGIKPSLVLGHSIGEYAAAVTAGIMDLQTAVLLVSLRGRLMNEAPGKGTMVSIFADKQNTQRLIGDLAETVMIAVHNSDEICVISGVEKDVLEVQKRAEDEHIRTKRLKVSHGFHSMLMHPAAVQFKDLVRNVKFKPANITFMSAMYARPLADDEVLQMDYWADHICNEVKFVETITAVKGYTDYLFLEIGSTNTLTSLCKYIFNTQAHYVNSLDIRVNAVTALNNAVSMLFVNGADVCWDKFVVTEETERKRVAFLPNYPFERSHYWNELYYDRANYGAVSGEPQHSLLGQKIDSLIMEDAVIFESIYTPEKPFFMSEHIIFDTAIAPAASYVALIISAMKEICNPESISIQEIELRSPLAVTDRRKVQICITGAKTGCAEYKIISRSLDSVDSEWTIHTQGKVIINRGHLHPAVNGDVEKWRGLEFDKNEGSEHAVYPAMTDASFKLGKGFRRLMKSWRNENEGVFYIEPAKNLPLTESYVIYPGVIDSVFHTMLCMVLESALLTLGRKETETMIPYFIGDFSFDYRAFDSLWVNTHAHIENNSIIGKCFVFNDQSEPVITIDNMITMMTNQKVLLGSRGTVWSDNCYNEVWKKVDKTLLQVEYASICIVSESETALEDFEHYSPLPVTRVVSDDVEYIEKKISELNKPALVVYCAGNGSDAPYGAMKKLFSLLKNSTIASSDNRCDLRIVTERAIPFQNDDINLKHSVLWGFARSYIAEFPVSFKGIVDLGQNYKIEDIISILIYGKYPELCVRDNKLYVSELQKHADFIRINRIQTTEIALKPDATYVISGGTGAVGKAYIEALTNAGAKHFAVLSRNEPKTEFISDMEALGAEVQCFTCDITDKMNVAHTIAQIQETMAPIKGVVNVSGVFRDKLINEMNWTDFEFVLAPKVMGSLNLYEATKNIGIEFFHMTSSITAILGNIGQTNYGAANYFMNCMAQYITANGIPASVICWGPWAGSDVVSTQAVIQNMESIGLKPHSVELGKELIQNSLRQYSGSFMAVFVDWNKFSSGSNNPHIKHLIHRFVNSGSEMEAQKVQDDFLSQVKDKSRKEIKHLLKDRVRSICCKEMGYGDGDISDDATFKELGADSIIMFAIRNGLNEMLQCNINVSDLYNYSTVQKLTEHIMDTVFAANDSGSGDTVDSEQIDQLASELTSLLDS